MAVFCCCRARPADEDSDDEGMSHDQQQYSIPLPILPPPARLADNCHIAECLAPMQRLETAASMRSGGAVSSTISTFPNHGHIYLGQLVLEESDADADGDIDSPVTKKHNGPLDAVRSKFSRNRLHASSARSSRTSVGASDEELARRAELKRLMHRRIQEELEQEDAPSNERSASVVSAAKSVTPPPSGSGPRDTLEFSMVDTSLPDKTSRSLVAVSEHSVVLDRPHHTTIELPVSSITVSESSSYHQREAELEAVEIRFADIVARRVPMEPRSSKFKEEFDLPVHPGIVTRSSMLLQKLHLPVPNFSRPRSRSSGQPPTLVYYHHGVAHAHGEPLGETELPIRKSVDTVHVSHTLSPA